MILIIDDEKYIRSSLAGLLADDGHQTMAVESAEKGEEVIRDRVVDLILLDIQMPGKDGITFLDDNRATLKNIPVIIISGRGDIATAVSAIKLGAYDYIEKPLNPERVLLTVRQALRLAQSLRSEQKLVGRILDKYQIIGQSKAVTDLWGMIEKAAASEATILITGENGTGKELVAHHLHYLSPRKSEPMVTVNCPAIPEHLFESELFGYVKGAFTGAQKDRVGRFESADGGTIFLDEIGDLPSSLQSKLLRVIESGQFEKVGSDTTISVDCRLLAATNRDLGKMVEKSQFREDLFYRLNVIAIEVPPLRQRVDDIPLLVDHFLSRIDAGEAYRFNSDAIGLMATFDWPGNIRHLGNIIQQLTFKCEPGQITATDVESIYNRQDLTASVTPVSGENKLTATVRQFESGFLSHLYQKYEGNIAAMARELNMDRGNLSRKLRQLGIM